MTDEFLKQALVYLVAAVLGVPLAKRLGLGSVLGYLLAGVAIGPFALKLVGHAGHDVMHFAEFGVVMMLFLVGLELRPSLLWSLRRPILGLGGLQVVCTSLVFAAVAVLLGVPLKAALALGMIFSMSSTAIVLQSLNERGLSHGTGGQATFSVLLFQDIAVIPILALFPVLGERAAPSQPDRAASSPFWQAAAVLGAVLFVVLAGRYLVRPAFRWLAETRLREAFTAAALMLVVGTALLMSQVGLSPALGTFLSGVVLAESEYRHELESDIEPFKGLLLGLFFISVGAQIDFGYVGKHPAQIAAWVLGSMLLKLLVLYGVGRLFGLDRPARWLFAFALSQVGEFAFVLLAYGVTCGVFSEAFSAPLLAVVALSMALTPLGFLILERSILPRTTRATARREDDEITDAEQPVVIAGFGRFGQIVGRMLRASGVGTTVLDLDPGMVSMLRKLGHAVYYGDASRPELLHAAGCAHAKLFVIAIDDTEQAVELAKTLRKHFPKLRILSRARNREHYYALKRAGVDQVFRETFGSAFELGVAAFRELGYRAHTAERLANTWRKHEEGALRDLESLYGVDQDSYFAAARRALEEAERLMRAEDPIRLKREYEAAWDNETLRQEVVRSKIGVAGEEPTAT